MRKGACKRNTQETEASVEFVLDGQGDAAIATGIGMLDHMLSHVAVHGRFDLKVTAKGDLDVDAHHTVEDCALALGTALDQALGDRKGIVRMGSAYVPMDEALGRVVVDLSGRAYAHVEVDWHGCELGGMSATLVNHFLQSLAVAARANVHAQILYGNDNHHQAEALFKALGLALDEATTLDPRRAARVPSTKGKL